MEQWKAKVIIKAIFKNSDGWIVVKPKFNQFKLSDPVSVPLKLLPPRKFPNGNMLLFEL